MYLHPFLKIGVTLAIFNFEGNTPSCMHLLYMLAKTDEVYSADILINLMGIFSIPTDFFRYELHDTNYTENDTNYTEKVKKKHQYVVTDTFSFLQNQIFYHTYSLYYTEACNEFAGLKPRDCARQHSLFRRNCSGGKPLATLCPLGPAQDLNLRPSASKISASPSD